MSGCAFRWFRGDVLVVASTGERSRITGTGALVWMVLGEPGTASQIGERIEESWPHLGSAAEFPVDDAVRTLSKAGLVALR